MEVEKMILKIVNFVDTFQFKDTETNAIETLIEKIGRIEDSRVIPYLEKNIKTTKTAIQISILTALAGQIEIGLQENYRFVGI
jgi:hypothetical protein